MNCALWLNKRKVYSAAEIADNADNLDVAALRGYFLAGSLVKWLEENGGAEYAERLAEISGDDPRLNERLAEVFGGKPLPAIALDGSGNYPVKSAGERPLSCSREPGSGSGYGFSSLAGLFGGTSGFFGSYSGSFINSFAVESYLRALWEYFFKGSQGSFSVGSFTSYRFWEWEWEWLWRLFGNYGSFGSFGSFSFGSLSPEFLSGLFGSFSPLAKLENLPFLDEYDRVMFETLMMCPLDRFGYGIHNI